MSFTVTSLAIILGLVSSAVVPVHRYYVGGSRQDHFYTLNGIAEIGTVTAGQLGKYGYRSEGIGFYVVDEAEPGTKKLHRYWKGSVSDHFYTTNGIAEIGTITPGQTGKYGYVSEGHTGYCYTTKSLPSLVPLYRYWLPSRADHFYTTHSSEIGTITPGQVGKYGYKYEGIQCYVFRKPPVEIIDEDFQQVLEVPGAIQVPTPFSAAKQIGMVTIGKVMRIKFTLLIKSFPTDTWRGVFRIGTKSDYYPRLPGCWLFPKGNPNHKGLHVSISNDNSLNPWVQVPIINEVNKNYRVEILIAPRRTQIEVNGRKVLDKVVVPMKKYYGKTYPVTVGDYKFRGANAIVKKISIERLGPDFVPLLAWENVVDKKIGNYRIGDVTIAEQMRIRFNLRVLTWPTDTWRGIIRIGPGNAYYPRLPGAWLFPRGHPVHKGLHVSVSNNAALNPWTQAMNVNQVNKEYQIEIIYTRKRYLVFVDGVLSVTRKSPSMSNYIGKTYPVYIGDPKFNPVNGIVTNVEIDKLVGKLRIGRTAAKEDEMNMDEEIHDSAKSNWINGEMNDVNVNNNNNVAGVMKLTKTNIVIGVVSALFGAFIMCSLCAFVILCNKMGLFSKKTKKYTKIPGLTSSSDEYNTDEA